MAGFKNRDSQQNDELPMDIDPMAGLESLAARQGATEGFTHEERYEIPEIDPNSVVIDELGYIPSATQATTATADVRTTRETEPTPMAIEHDSWEAIGS